VTQAKEIGDAVTRGVMVHQTEQIALKIAEDLANFSLLKREKKQSFRPFSPLLAVDR